MTDAIDAAVRAAIFRTLCRRADRQRKIAKNWMVEGAKGARILSGEGAVALRIAAALDEAADAIEAEGQS